jgi:hypothetical protein
VLTGFALKIAEGVDVLEVDHDGDLGRSSEFAAN